MTDLTARDAMTTSVQTVHPENGVREVVQCLADHHISGVPVVDEAARVVGIVTEADLIDEHKRAARIPRTALFGIYPLPGDVMEQAAERGEMLTAGDMMTRKVVSATEETKLHEIADLMVQHRINRIPIDRDEQLVGIVSRADIVKAMARPQ